MNFNQAKIISVYYNKGDRKPYDVNGKPIAYIGEEFIGSTEATTIRFYLGEDIDSSTALITTKRADGEVRLDFCSKVGTGATSYYEVTLNGWYSAVKGKAVVVFKAYNGTVTLNEDGDEILSATGRIVVSDIFNLNVAYAPNATIGVPPDDPDPEVNWYFALSTKLDKADSITVAGALPTLTGDVYDDRYFYIEDEGVGRLYYINGSTAIEVVFQVGTLRLTPEGNGNVSADTGKLSWEEEYGSVKLGLYDNNYLNIGQDLEYYGKADGAISKGDIIQFGTPEGNHFQIKKAVQSEINANPKLIMGIAKENIADNAFGYVLAFGRIRNINTSAFSLGDFLWFNSGGSTAGEWTTTQPTAPNAKILMAVVVKVDNNGIILVRPTIEPKLSELQDINITSIADNQILRYNSATSRWENSSELTTAETNISEILSGDQIVGKATNDKDGNAIDTTYLKVATASSTYVPLSSKGVANGVAPLGADNKIPSIHLPGGVDDIKEFADLASFPPVGEASIIYVALDTNKIYRWGGSAYVEISSSLALGTTNTTAFPGDRGLALETKTDNIVDGTQTLSDTRITNSATGEVPLIVNGITGTSVNLAEYKLNNSNRVRISNEGNITISGNLFASSVINQTSASNSRVFLLDEGAKIQRNIADANTALIVNQENSSSTGDILRLQFAGANKLEITKDGFINQNGTRFIDTNGTGNTHIGLTSGGATIKGEYNVAVGQNALSGINNAGATSNIMVGWNAGGGITSGSTNVGVGHRGAFSITSGFGNTFVGHTAGFNASQLATAQNSTAIGNQAYTDKSNQMVFGNSSVSEFVFNRNAGALALLPQTQISSSSFPPLLSIRTSTANNVVISSANFLSSTTSDMIDNFGITNTFSIRDDANVINPIGTIGALRSGADNSGRLIFRTFTTGTENERMTIMPDGKVGIGTSAPAMQLSVITSSNGDSLQIRRNSTTTNDYATLGFRVATVDATNSFAEIRAIRTNRVVSADTDLSFHTWTNGAIGERMRIRDDGLVGINETSPSAQLQVKSGATTRVPLVVDSVASLTANLQEWRINGATTASILSDGRFDTPTGMRSFANGNNAYVNVASTGTIISRNIADTNPALIVNLANASATGNIQVWQKSGVAKATITNGGGATFSSFVDLSERMTINVTNSVQNEAILVSNATDDLFFVDRTDGDVYNLNGTYGTISDLRLKENIVQARDYTEDLMKLNVVKYSFKKDHSETPTHLGFIAQEVEEVFPGLVETKKTKELEDMKAIKMSVLIPMLVKTIQELKKELDEVKAKIG